MEIIVWDEQETKFQIKVLQKVLNESEIMEAEDNAAPADYQNKNARKVNHSVFSR